MATSDKGKKMKRPTAEKRMIQNEKRRQLNRAFRSKVKTAIKNFEKAVADKDSTRLQPALSEAHALLDKAVKRGVYKLNKTRRTKSRLAIRAATAQG